ncbi:MAG: hypothetical protein ACR2QC_02340 [Gammaproteobacteria bacterium]
MTQSARSVRPARKSAHSARPSRVARKPAATAPREGELPRCIAETIRIADSIGGFQFKLPPRHKVRDDGYNPIDEFGKFQPPPRHKVRD